MGGNCVVSGRERTIVESRGRVGGVMAVTSDWETAFAVIGRNLVSFGQNRIVFGSVDSWSCRKEGGGVLCGIARVRRGAFAIAI